MRRLGLAALLLVLPGCVFWDGDDDADDVWIPGSERVAPEPAPSISGGTAGAPHITAIEVPAFPPLGRDGEVRVECEDELALAELAVLFRSPSTFPVSGTHKTVTLHGSDLGEGYGLLRLRVTNMRGLYAERAVENLLVDLTPPEVELEATTVSPQTELALWVQDQWVLGFVELSFRGKTFRHDFPSVYPPTFGTAWDVSRVTFPTRELSEGAANAIVVVGDAAGNRATKEVALVVDATPPNVTLDAPSDGQVVGGSFDVSVVASDPHNPAAVAIDVRIGGSLVGTVLGPSGRLTVDTASLPSGSLEVQAIARDAAGNASEPATVHVQVN